MTIESKQQRLERYRARYEELEQALKGGDISVSEEMRELRQSITNVRLSLERTLS